ncbi:MAG TPA: ATP-binding protein [Clostridiales bacterium]|nr:ATP-binding protein [Clostridiales bacterium]
MKRNIEEQLIQWKQKRRRKPLILYGARQIGKTYSIKEFGKKYFENTIYINFEINQKIIKDFDENISPSFLLHRMEVFFGQKIDPNKTLIIFDEIQACERALTSLKYFYEDVPEYHIIAAGSLLGVAMNREKYSFPVGKVDYLNMYPMRLDEFMLALGEELLLEEIRTCYFEKRKMDSVLHDKALQLYREYLIIGGMPEAVAEYSLEKDVLNTAEIQQGILNAYVSDMAKYATPSDTTKIMACFDSIPAQLAKDNRKFQYKVVAQGGKTSLFGASIDWLLAAGIVTKCEKVEHGIHPLGIYKNLSSFKLYMSDVGLLTTKAGTTAYDIISGNDHVFIGALTENYIANILEMNRYKLYYWTSGGEAEVDFIIEQEGKVVPVEVKAREHTKSRSLSVFLSKYPAETSIRFSGRNFGWENGIESIPLYAAWLV